MTITATFEEFEQHYSDFNETSRLLCVRCHAQSELQAARDRGLDDPFHAYENTPTSRELTERLADALLPAFPFREFRLCSGAQTHALEAFPGSLICPARVVVDFVEDAAVQDSIVNWVDAFLRDARQTQWEVWFYRSFEVHRHPSGSCKQGHAGLLRCEESHPPRGGIRRHAWYGPPPPQFG